MRFNKKSLSIQEIDYALGCDDNEQYHSSFEKSLNVKVTKYNANTNPSNFYYNFIFYDSYNYKKRNVEKRFYPMIKRYKRIALNNHQSFSDNDIKRMVFQHKKKYKLNGLFRKTYKDLQQELNYFECF